MFFDITKDCNLLFKTHHIDIQPLPILPILNANDEEYDNQYDINEYNDNSKPTELQILTAPSKYNVHIVQQPTNDMVDKAFMQ